MSDDLGIVHGCSDRRDEGAGGWKFRYVGSCILAVVGDARSACANTRVTGAEKQRDALGAERGELIADGRGVAFRHSLFMVTVGCGDDFRDRVDVLVAKEKEPGQVRFVGVRWGRFVCLKRRHAARGVQCYRSRIHYAKDGLQVKVAFCTRAHRAVVHSTPIYRYLSHFKSRIDSIGPEILQEGSGVGAI